MTTEALALIIGGVGTFITALFAGWKAMREGTGARQRDLVRDIERRADRAEHDLRQEQLQRRFFEQRCALAEAGRPLPDISPPVWVDWKDPTERR